MNCTTSGCSREVKYKTLSLCRTCYSTKWQAANRRTPEGAAKEAGRRAEFASVHGREKSRAYAATARDRARTADPEGYLKKQRDKATEVRLKRTTEQRLAWNAHVMERGTGWSQDARALSFRLQDGRCAICPRALNPEDPKAGCLGDHYEMLGGVRVPTKRIAAHTKHPRGLLCQACNSGLGFYEAANGQRAAGLRIDAYEEYISRYGG